MWQRVLSLFRRATPEPAAEDSLALETMLAAGFASHQAGDLTSAERVYRQVLQTNPEQTTARHSLGVLLAQRGSYAEAERLLRGTAESEPGNPVFQANMGNVLDAMGKPWAALEFYERAIKLRPDFADACANFGHVLGVLRQSPHLDAALQPRLADAYCNLGNAFQLQGRIGDAVEQYDSALSVSPDHARAHNNIGAVLQGQGRLDDAIQRYRLAKRSDPFHAVARSNLIFALDMSPRATIEMHQAERREWDEMVAAQIQRASAHDNDPEPERRLRIGYVSADIREHSAATVFGAMLVLFDRARFDVFAYSSSELEDEITEKFRESVTFWRNIVNVSDAAVAELIQKDEIDILVDLSGHSAGNRLLVFARKPAPVQITAWGYATSTGMRAMDVFFADPVVVPPEEMPLFAESVRYLPCIVGYFSPRVFPDVAELPARKSDRITFGSFNRLAKVSDETFALWGKVLGAIPESRMLLKAIELDDPVAKERVIAKFREAGVGANRLLLLGKSPWAEHAAAFNLVDIALDPFPHGGGVTALEGLMMGVPVITLRVPTIVGRTSASIVTTLGLGDWVADTPEEYVGIAWQKTQDLNELARLRQGLREAFMSSALGDASRYVKAVEGEYRLLWREWCARQTSRVPAVLPNANSSTVEGELPSSSPR